MIVFVFYWITPSCNGTWEKGIAPSSLRAIFLFVPFFLKIPSAICRLHMLAGGRVIDLQPPDFLPVKE